MALVEQVAKGKDGMTPEHPRTGEAHDLPDLFTLSGGVTMDGAVGAGRLLRVEGAVGQTRLAVAQQVGAIRAQRRAAAVAGAAENPDQRGDGAAFALEARLHGGNYRSTASRYNGVPVSCCGAATGWSSASRTPPNWNGGWKDVAAGCA